MPGLKTERLVVHQELPLNAELRLGELMQYPVTPEELVYARNHCPIRTLDVNTFRVRVDGLVESQAEYTLADIKRTFTKIEVVAALQCAGNRRKVMQDKKSKPVEGLLWGQGTIANVRWGGVRLRDLLLRSRIRPVVSGTLYACFASHVTACEEDAWFGSSVPLEKVLDEQGDALLAYEMNGRPLRPEHGAPFRIVIPGYSGARWVKWVDQISVSQRESENFYQQRDYKVLPPQVQNHDTAESYWSKVPPLQENPLNSVIAATQVENSTLYVRGYAVGGRAGQVRRVFVTIDEGKSWRPANITYQEGRWSWTLWEAAVSLPAGKTEYHGRVLSRAEDEKGNSQSPDTSWNLRGVAYSGYGEDRF